MSQNPDTERDAELVDMRDTLRTLLQRYKDVAFMDSPEWETYEEIPVENAERLLESGASTVIEDEFHLLRKLSLKIEAYFETLANPPEFPDPDPQALDVYHERMDTLKMDIKELISEHRDLKERQGIIRVD